MHQDLTLLIIALDGLREGIVVTGPAEADVPILYANAAFVQMTGYPRPELIGRNCRLLQGAGTDGGVRERMRQAIRDGVEFQGELLNYRKDGSAFLNSVRIQPVRNASGRVTHFVGTHVDVSAADAELRRSEDRYRMVVEHAPYGIFALDADGAFTEINRAGQEILGREAAEVVGRSFREFVAAHDMERADQALAGVLTDSVRHSEFPVAVTRPGGEMRDLELVMTRFDDRGLPALYGIARDVTELRTRDLHLRRVERLASLGTLIAGVAHELNNPLTAIRGFAQLLLMDPRSEEDLESLQLIRREADRMAKIVADLRTVARESHEQSGYRAVDVNDVVSHVIRLRAYAMKTHNVALDASLAPGLPAIHGSSQDLEQIVLNLVTNAEQALAESGGPRTLAVRTRRGTGSVCVEVEDNGPGIPAERLDRIFDPFFTTKAPGEGTGLGLSLVQRMVHEHGGRITVHSHPGTATCFTVFLPLAAPAAPDPGGGR